MNRISAYYRHSLRMFYAGRPELALRLRRIADRYRAQRRAMTC